MGRTSVPAATLGLLAGLGRALAVREVCFRPKADHRRGIQSHLALRTGFPDGKLGQLCSAQLGLS